MPLWMTGASPLSKCILASSSKMTLFIASSSINMPCVAKRQVASLLLPSDIASRIRTLPCSVGPCISILVQSLLYARSLMSLSLLRFLSIVPVFLCACSLSVVWLHPDSIKIAILSTSRMGKLFVWSVCLRSVVRLGFLLEQLGNLENGAGDFLRWFLATVRLVC